MGRREHGYTDASAGFAAFTRTTWLLSLHVVHRSSPYSTTTCGPRAGAGMSISRSTAGGMSTPVPGWMSRSLLSNCSVAHTHPGFACATWSPCSPEHELPTRWPAASSGRPVAGSSATCTSTLSVCCVTTSTPCPAYASSCVCAAAGSGYSATALGSVTIAPPSLILPRLVGWGIGTGSGVCPWRGEGTSQQIGTDVGEQWERWGPEPGRGRGAQPDSAIGLL